MGETTPLTDGPAVPTRRMVTAPPPPPAMTRPAPYTASTAARTGPEGPEEGLRTPTARTGLLLEGHRTEEGLRT